MLMAVALDRASTCQRLAIVYIYHQSTHRAQRTAAGLDIYAKVSWGSLLHVGTLYLLYALPQRGMQTISDCTLTGSKPDKYTQDCCHSCTL